MTPEQQAEAVEEALKWADMQTPAFRAWQYAKPLAAEVRRLRELLTLSEAHIRRLESELHAALQRADDPDDIGFPRK